MRKWFLFILGLLILIIFVIILTSMRMGETEKIDPNFRDNEEKCRVSGGYWGAICSSTFCTDLFCDCKSKCDTENFPSFNYFHRPIGDNESGLIQIDTKECGYKISNKRDGYGDLCVNCTKDSDCRDAPSMNIGKGYCMEYASKCVKGLCYDTRNIYIGVKSEDGSIVCPK